MKNEVNENFFLWFEHYLSEVCLWKSWSSPHLTWQRYFKIPNFDQLKILLNSAVFLLPRKNEISFYAPRMRFDQKCEKNTIYQAKTGFQFLQLEYDFTKKATKCYKKTTENCDFTQNKNQFLPDIWYFFEIFVKSHSMGIKWNFVFAGNSVHRRNKQNFNWSKNYKNRDISWNKNRFDAKLSSKHL